MENKDKISNKINGHLEFKHLEEIRNKVFYWTAELNSVLDIEQNGEHILKVERDHHIKGKSRNKPRIIKAIS